MGCNGTGALFMAVPVGVESATIGFPQRQKQYRTSTLESSTVIRQADPPLVRTTAQPYVNHDEDTSSLSYGIYTLFGL